VPIYLPPWSPSYYCAATDYIFLTFTKTTSIHTLHIPFVFHTSPPFWTHGFRTLQHHAQTNFSVAPHFSPSLVSAFKKRSKDSTTRYCATMQSDSPTSKDERLCQSTQEMESMKSDSDCHSLSLIYVIAPSGVTDRFFLYRETRRPSNIQTSVLSRLIPYKTKIFRTECCFVPTTTKQH